MPLPNSLWQRCYYSSQEKMFNTPEKEGIVVPFASQGTIQPSLCGPPNFGLLPYSFSQSNVNFKVPCNSLCPIKPQASTKLISGHRVTAALPRM